MGLCNFTVDNRAKEHPLSDYESDLVPYCPILEYYSPHKATNIGQLLSTGLLF
jgi:hypothetical protein